MIGIEVTRDGRTWLLEDRETVVRMARIGQLGPADGVRESREADFVEARTLGWLAEAFEGDPWDAWEELDGTDPEEAWSAAAVPVAAEQDEIEDTDVTKRERLEDTEEAPPAPSPTLSVSFKPAAEERPPKKESAGPVPPAPPPALAAEATPEERGKVIAFPSSRPARPPPSGSELPAALLQPLPVQDLVPNDSDSVRLHGAPPPESPKPLYPWLVGMAMVMFLAGFTLVIYSIQRDARWTSGTVSNPAPTVAVAEVPEPAEPEPTPEPVEVDEADLVSELEALRADLKERIPASPITLSGGPDDLESALLIELSNMKLGPVKVDAPVLSWTGAQNDVVEVADVEVRLPDNDSIERQLAVVGLVVGKYLQHYGFQIRTFSVVVTGDDGVSRKRQMDPVAARHLWSGRKDLYGFLTGR